MARTMTPFGPVPSIMNPPIITLFPVCTNPRVLMLPRERLDRQLAVTVPCPRDRGSGSSRDRVDDQPSRARHPDYRADFVIKLETITVMSAGTLSGGPDYCRITLPRAPTGRRIGFGELAKP